VLRLLKILEIYTVIMIFKSAYNEKINAQKLGFEYYSLPVDGNNDYTPEKLDAFASPINKDDRILIHCLSAGRATPFLYTDKLTSYL